MSNNNKLEYWLRFYGMSEENIDKCINQIAEGYGACRYLEGVNDGAAAVSQKIEPAQCLRIGKPRKATGVLGRLIKKMKDEKAKM